jgi:glycerol kinase
MQADAKIPIRELRVDGGATANDMLMQFQADLLGCKVVRPVITETTAMGAAFLAGLGAGIWKDQQEISMHWKTARLFEPELAAEAQENLLNGWRRAVKATIAWANDREY